MKQKKVERSLKMINFLHLVKTDSPTPSGHGWSLKTDRVAVGGRGGVGERRGFGEGGGVSTSPHSPAAKNTDVFRGVFICSRSSLSLSSSPERMG